MQRLRRRLAEIGTGSLDDYRRYLADNPRIGLLRRKRELFAIYVRDGNLCLWIAGKEIVPGSASLQIGLLRLPFARRFDISLNAESVFRCWYWTDLSRVPEPEDMMCYIHENAATSTTLTSLDRPSATTSVVTSPA
jgi:hypothetical protein